MMSGHWAEFLGIFRRKPKHTELIILETLGKRLAIPKSVLALVTR